MGRKGEMRILFGGSVGPGICKDLKRDAAGLILGRFAHGVEELKMW